MKDLASLLPILVIAVVFWLVAIRPAQRRARETVGLQSRLAIGDDVMLTSGVFGTIVETGEDELRLEIAPGVAIRVARGAVASVRADAASADAEPTDAESAGEEPTDTYHAEER